MTITTRDQLISALGNNSTNFIFDKATITSQVAGRYTSLWRAGGTPGAGAIPTTAAICDNTLAGAIAFTQQTAPATSYLAQADVACGNNTVTVELHDRLAHRGGLSLNVGVVQSVNLDLQTLGLNASRRGAADFSDIQWWLEVYTSGGSSASIATINVTYDDGTTGDLATDTLAVNGLNNSHLLPLNRLVTASGRFIRGINTFGYTSPTGTAGNCGFTATRQLASMPTPIANKSEKFDWAQLGLQQVPNGACLMLAVLGNSTSSGTVRGTGKIAHG